jgi:hypothetical protein
MRWDSRRNFAVTTGICFGRVFQKKNQHHPRLACIQCPPLLQLVHAFSCQVKAELDPRPHPQTSSTSCQSTECFVLYHLSKPRFRYQLHCAVSASSWHFGNCCSVYITHSSVMFSEVFKGCLAFSGYLWSIHFSEYNVSWHCQTSAGIQWSFGSALSPLHAEPGRGNTTSPSLLQIRYVYLWLGGQQHLDWPTLGWTDLP